MDDRMIMENMLQLQKGACDLFMHGTVESSTDNVHQTFRNALNAALTMQDGIYDQMASRGWYCIEQAEQNKITNVRQRFSAN